MERPIFNESPKRVYEIRKEGETFVMPNAGVAAGITVGDEFEVYQNHSYGRLLGTVVACELYDFSTTLYAKGSGFALDQDGVALKSRSGLRDRYEFMLQARVLRTSSRELIQTRESFGSLNGTMELSSGSHLRTEKLYSTFTT